MTRMEIDIDATGDTTRMILTAQFDSLEGMEQTIATGVATAAAWTVSATAAEVTLPAGLDTVTE